MQTPTLKNSVVHNSFLMCRCAHLISELCRRAQLTNKLCRSGVLQLWKTQNAKRVVPYCTDLHPSKMSCADLHDSKTYRPNSSWNAHDGTTHFCILSGAHEKHCFWVGQMCTNQFLSTPKHTWYGDVYNILLFYDVELYVFYDTIMIWVTPVYLILWYHPGMIWYHDLFRLLYDDDTLCVIDQ